MGSVFLLSVGVVFLAAAADKALSPRDTALVLVYVLGPDQHPFVVSLLTVSLLTFESVLGITLITSSALRFAVPVAVITLIGFSAFLVWIMLSPAAPESCGCGRLFGVVVDAESAAPVGLARNVVMLVLIVAGARLVK